MEKPLALRELARDIHYAITDDGLAPASPVDNNAMREAILRVLTPERIEACFAWLPMESAPKDGTYLVANDKGQVAPWINGVIHNNVGTPWDWSFGERATQWAPLPRSAA